LSRGSAAFQYRLLGASQLEKDALRDVLLRSFAFPLSRWAAYYDLVGQENFRLLKRDDGSAEGRVVAGLALIPMGEWFGGASIPMTGIAAVGVAPEERAGGVARTLMTRTLEELRAQGIPLSTLYASTQHLYRAVGYEQAGTRVKYSIHLPSMPIAPHPDRSLPMRAIDPTDSAPFSETYAKLGAMTNGMLDRGRAIWQRVHFRPETEMLQGYLVGEEGDPQGYVIFTLQPQESGYDLRVRDLVALSAAAYRRILVFFQDARSIGRDLHWFGPPTDPLLCVTEEQQYERTSIQERWLLRIVDIAKACEARGYPPGIEAELHIEIEDDVLAANAGRYVLRVSDGRGTLTKGGRGSLRAHIRGFAPLFSGMLSPAQLQAVGWIDADSGAIADAGRIFAGPQPWMPDSF
jgi:predicted acetyltransferase